MREDNQAKPLHYFNVYFFPFEGLTSQHWVMSCHLQNISSVQIESILPKSEDQVVMHKCFHFLVVWVLKKHAFLQGVDSCVEQHSRHEYYKEMPQKSEVGPTKTNVGSVKIPGLQEPVKVINGQFHLIVFGGDQMAAVCARGAQHIRSNSTSKRWFGECCTSRRRLARQSVH